MSGVGIYGPPRFVLQAMNSLWVCSPFRVMSPLAPGVQPIYAIKPGAKGDITLKGEQTQSEFIAWSTKRGGPYIPTPLIYRDQLYVCSNNGVLSAYGVRTGQRLYQERLGGTGGSFSASPVAADGKIYLASEDGDVFVIKAGPTYELLATNSMGEALMATPAISEGLIIIRGLKDVFAIGQPTTTKPHGHLFAASSTRSVA